LREGVGKEKRGREKGRVVYMLRPGIVDYVLYIAVVCVVVARGGVSTPGAVPGLFLVTERCWGHKLLAVTALGTVPDSSSSSGLFAGMFFVIGHC
jgi:hypothetical protein